MGSEDAAGVVSAILRSVVEMRLQVVSVWLENSDSFWEMICDFCRLDGSAKLSVGLWLVSRSFGAQKSPSRPGCKL